MPSRDLKSHIAHALAGAALATGVIPAAIAQEPTAPAAAPIAQVTTMINSLQAARVRAAEAAGTRILRFDLDIDRRIGLWETAAMPRIFDIGCRAAREQLPAIGRMLELPLAA